MVLFLILMMSYASASAIEKVSNEKETSFKLTIENDETSILLKGSSDHGATPSSYSIYMNEENGKCALHMLNFRTPPVKGMYDVQNREVLTTGAVCILEINGTRERLASESGTFYITEIGNRGSFIHGHFDMVMVGNISGNKYRFTGEVESTLIQSDSIFR